MTATEAIKGDMEYDQNRDGLICRASSWMQPMTQEKRLKLITTGLDCSPIGNFTDEQIRMAYENRLRQEIKKSKEPLLTDLVSEGDC